MIKKSVKISASALILCIMVCAALLLTACKPSARMAAAYDNDEIIARNSSYITINSSQTKSGYQFSFSAKEFTGVKTVDNVTVTTENPKITMSANVDSGEFKIVFVDNSYNVTVVAEGNVDGSVTTSLPVGRYTVKMVGRYAKVRFSVNLYF